MSRGLICLSACLAGEIPQRLLQNDYDGALEKAVYYRDLFGRENFFIELQDHGIEEEQRILPGLARIAAEAGVGMAATNDSHYIEKEDSRTHGILLCIQTGSTVFCSASRRAAPSATRIKWSFRRMSFI